MPLEVCGVNSNRVIAARRENFAFMVSEELLDNYASPSYSYYNMGGSAVIDLAEGTGLVFRGNRVYIAGIDQGAPDKIYFFKIDVSTPEIRKAVYIELTGCACK